MQALVDALAGTGSDDAGLKQCLRRAETLAAGLERMLGFADEEGVRWVEVAGRGFTVGFSPFEVADRLHELMTARPCAWR